MIVEEVLRQVRLFRPSPKMIKRSIGKLIEREYLRRDEEDNALYHYLA